MDLEICLFKVLGVSQLHWWTCSDPAHPCAKIMTWRDVGDSLATQNFDADSVVIAPKTPDSSKISQVCTPLSRDYYPVYSPCYFDKSPPSPHLPPNSMTDPANQHFSKLSPIHEAILGNDDYLQ